MTEAEMKLMLLKYNILAKKRAITAYTWTHTGENVHDEAEWSKCVDEMRGMMNDLREHGYKFTCAGSKTADKVLYEVYKIVPIDNR